jgi:hypothetical protein
MDNFLTNFLIEIGLFTFLGVLYYFYQKRKIVHYEENKTPIVMGYILQSLLTERGENPHRELDPLIESVDDYLQNKTASPPIALLKVYSASESCSPELRAVISEGLQEIES